MLRLHRIWVIGAAILCMACSDLRVCLACAQESDPGLAGPFAVTREEYDFGETAFMRPGSTVAVELRGSVHHPADLAHGPYPLVVMVHGVHVSCFKKKKAALGWPCVAPFNAVPNYQGYDYLAEGLASHGFFVVSISINGVWGSRDGTTTDAVAVLLKHLEIWSGFNSTGGEPFGTRFVGKIDMQRVGLLGHSAAGPAVVEGYLASRQPPLPYAIKAVFALAPRVELETPINNVPFAAMLSYCDGDVGLAGVRYYDDSRYNQPGDPAPKHTILVMGANHNFYNSIWTPGQFKAGTRDDADAYGADPECSSARGRRLTDAQQRAVARAYVLAFFRLYLARETQFIPLLSGAAPVPASAAPATVLVSYHAPDQPGQRLDVNRLLDETNLSINTTGGGVSQNGLAQFDLCGGPTPQPLHCLTNSTAQQEPHTFTSDPNTRGLSQLRLVWEQPSASYQNDLPPEARDVHLFEALQFRVSVNFSDPRNRAGVAQDFTVELVDGSGRSAAVRVGNLSAALYYPPGKRQSLPRSILNTARIPLSAFAGISLDDVRSIRFKFDRQASGALLVADIAFVGMPAVPD